MPKLAQDVVMVPGSLALVFDIDLTGRHANKYLVQNVSRALVSRLEVKFGGATVQDTNGYDIFKTFEDLFLSVYEHDKMLMEGIQSTKLCKVRSNSGDKPTSRVDTENKLEVVYRMKYRINLDHQILTSSGVFYPQALVRGKGF